MTSPSRHKIPTTVKGFPMKLKYVMNIVTKEGRGADDTENTATSIVACWTVFTELLPGNALIKSVTIKRKRFVHLWICVG
jgi:hypothetical protein